MSERDDEENKEATESGDGRGRTQSRGGNRWMRIWGGKKRVTEKKREGMREGWNRGEDRRAKREKGMEREGATGWGAGDWRAAGWMNGGQASEGPLLSGPPGMEKMELDDDIVGTGGQWPLAAQLADWLAF
ncbi:unnamed protein product [Pleuronectes platessa]|uniref:Uncharacterized protein n=1 Tax=Pleuronectes platessa TaxID=8262 RepID=A0A9N7TJX7_PLEPL|nr:unnamed protein product [Pleuronectes platessa]